MSQEAKEPTFANDTKLPLLPLPKLEDTFQKGLRESIQAILQKNQQDPKVRDQLLQEYDGLAKQAIEELQQAQTKVLQSRKNAQRNYIGDWWEEFAYLRNRYPNVINTNVFCVRDSDFVQMEKKGEQGGAREEVRPCYQPNPITTDPLERAALVILESMYFKNLVQHEVLPAERTGRGGATPICMRQYKKYWTLRKPGVECDEIVCVAPQDAKIVHIIYRGEMFFIKLVAPKVDGGGERDVTFDELKAAVRFATRQIDEKLSSKNISTISQEECVGILTTLDRTTWGKTWQDLESLSENNKQILHQICTAMTTVCIDTINGSCDPILNFKQGITAGSHGNYWNRWYDRSSLRIVSPNGVVLENGDHTAMDAIVMASTPMDLKANFSRKFYAKYQQQLPPKEGEGDEVIGKALVQMIQWDLTPSIRQTILSAAAKHENISKVSHVDVFIYHKAGRMDLGKKYKVNPDAFVQQMLQLAYYRDSGKRKNVLPVYETASTRVFQEGRTDTIRSLTCEQHQFVTSFDDPNISAGEKAKLLFAAMKKHLELTMQSSTGQGYDRHLFALKIAQGLLLKKPLPKIFAMPAVVESGSYQLLTSQMIGNMFVGGFGHALPDGYGCCYYMRKNSIWIVVSSHSAGGLTDLDRFQKHLHSTFDDVLACLEQCAVEKLKKQEAKL